MSVWDWLVREGLYQDLLSTTVFILAGSVFVPFVRRAYRRIAAEQERIADRLDPNTPGGLGDLPDAPYQQQLLRKERADARDVRTL